MKYNKNMQLERKLFAAQIAGSGIKYGAIGLVGKMGCEGIGFLLDKINHDVFPQVATIDEKVGQAILEKGGIVGKAAIEADRYQGDFWNRVFGRTNEKQREWRGRNDTEAPSYLKQKAEAGYKGETIRTEVQTPSHNEFYYQRYVGDSVGNIMFCGALLIGLTIGYCRGLKRYLEAKIKQIEREKSSGVGSNGNKEM